MRVLKDAKCLSLVSIDAPKYRRKCHNNANAQFMSLIECLERQTCPHSTVPHLVLFVGDKKETRKGSVNGSKQENHSLVEIGIRCGEDVSDGSDCERPRRHPILHRCLKTHRSRQDNHYLIVLATLASTI